MSSLNTTAFPASTWRERAPRIRIASRQTSASLPSGHPLLLVGNRQQSNRMQSPIESGEGHLSRYRLPLVTNRPANGLTPPTAQIRAVHPLLCQASMNRPTPNRSRVMGGQLRSGSQTLFGTGRRRRISDVVAVSTRGHVLSGVVGTGKGCGPVSKARDSATASWNPPFRTAIQRSIDLSPSPNMRSSGTSRRSRN